MHGSVIHESNDGVGHRDDRPFAMSHYITRLYVIKIVAALHIAGGVHGDSIEATWFVDGIERLGFDGNLAEGAERHATMKINI